MEIGTEKKKSEEKKNGKREKQINKARNQLSNERNVKGFSIILLGLLYVAQVVLTIKS